MRKGSTVYDALSDLPFPHYQLLVAVGRMRPRNHVKIRTCPEVNDFGASHELPR